MSFLINLPRYQCHKQVSALQIKHCIPNPRGVELHFADERYVPMQMTDEWMKKTGAEPGGYFVWYDDGYQSYSPAQAFEAGYTRIPA